MGLPHPILVWLEGFMFRKALLAPFMLSFCCCVGVPQGIVPVQDFDISRYLGTWYEIARLDHSFERGLSKVSAEYGRRKDGGIRVLNRGYDRNKSKWRTAEGKAYFVGDPWAGRLKVSFFGPFYGSYVIFSLDKKDYQYAFVTGPNRHYLWLLSRTPRVSGDLKEQFIQESNKLGFDTAKIIFVNQE